MRTQLLSSLTNRIFLASALLAVLSIGFAVYFVSVQVTDEAEAELRRGLEEAGTLVDQHRATLLDTFTRHARLIADLPRFKAAVYENDPPTVEPLAADYRAQVNADLAVVTGRTGATLAAVGASGIPPEAIPSLTAIRDALAGRESATFWPHPDGLLQVVTVPILIGVAPPEILGTLSLGFLLDQELALQFRNVTESEIAFAVDGRIRTSTLPQPLQDRLTPLLSSQGVSRLTLGEHDYVALLRPLSPSAGAQAAAAPASPGASAAAQLSAPMAILLRSRTERLRFLSTIHTGLAVTALFAVLLATLLSYLVSRTVTRPLATITATMREVAATGDLTRKIRLRHEGKWDDEDARLLASTFNTLTDSIARFQREAAQRERLSSLGRLSTVIAHEIRNPLMIIKAALRTMRADGPSPQELREAVGDIDEEVVRLNRIVNDVLDFARPIRFEFASADLNALCRDAVTATTAVDPWPPIAVRLDPSTPPLVTDAERLRIALVNILANARQAVQARQPAVAAPVGARPGGAILENAGSSGTPEIELATEPAGAAHVAIVVRDRGIGIEPADLPRVFEPYFTTKRSGTGLGLAIAKNIIDGMGGAIHVTSRPQEGTEIRIVLPDRPADARTGAAASKSPAG